MDDHSIKWGSDKVREVMRERIEEIGATRYEVAESASVNRSHLYAFLRGDCGISFETLFRVCITINLDPCACFPTIEEMDSEYQKRHPFG